MIVCGYMRRLENKIIKKCKYRKSNHRKCGSQHQITEDIMGIICWYYESEWLHLFLCNRNKINGNTINWKHFMIPFLAVF